MKLGSTVFLSMVLVGLLSTPAAYAYSSVPANSVTAPAFVTAVVREDKPVEQVPEPRTLWLFGGAAFAAWLTYRRHAQSIAKS